MVNLKSALILVSALVPLQVAFAQWPDPKQQGDQRLQGVNFQGDYVTSFAEGEVLQNELRGKLAERFIGDIRLAEQLEGGLYHDLEAERNFAVRVDQLYVSSAGSAFRGLATKTPMSASRDPRRGDADGSILLGVDFLKAIRNDDKELWPLARAILVYHEVAHVLQMKRNLIRSPAQNEAQADWLAGYCLGLESENNEFGRAYGIAATATNIEAVFGNPRFAPDTDTVHGPPSQRAERVIAGWRAGRSGIDLETAIEISRE